MQKLEDSNWKLVRQKREEFSVHCIQIECIKGRQKAGQGGNVKTNSFRKAQVFVVSSDVMN